MILFFIFFKNEDVVNSTTKYIPTVMLDRRGCQFQDLPIQIDIDIEININIEV